MGAAGTILGAAIPLPEGLAQPFTVCVTVYAPGVVAVIDPVIPVLLHNNDPVYPDAVNTELPQLFTTLTTGADGTVNGDAVPVPSALVHPFNVWVAVYVPSVCTVIDAVVAPVLHNNEPALPDAVSTELPQLLATFTVGADGIAMGAAVTLPALLAHPFNVCVTEYVPPVCTVMAPVVSPVLHSNDPV